jgi:CTP:molybdopterin cytidylyltransferase MocA
VVLAAGASSRLGEPKQLVELGGERLLERAVRVAREAGLSPVVVVLGCRAEEIQQGCNLEGASIVRNAGWAEGMGSSIRKGVAALGAESEGLVLMTCDQPAAGTEHLLRLVDAADVDAADVDAADVDAADVAAADVAAADVAAADVAAADVAAADKGRAVGSSYAGRIGVPAFFPASRFGKLLSLRGEEGARSLLGEAHTVDLPDGELDVDTATELDAARKRFS